MKKKLNKKEELIKKKTAKIHQQILSNLHKIQQKESRQLFSQCHIVNMHLLKFSTELIFFVVLCFSVSETKYQKIIMIFYYQQKTKY